MASSPQFAVVLALLAISPLVRAETLDCEFNDGRISAARLSPSTSTWLWDSPALAPWEFWKDLKRGAPFWFVRATFSKGSTEGTVAGTAAPPANDPRPAVVAFGAGFVSLVSIGSNGTDTLMAAMERGKDGRIAAAYFFNTGLPGRLRIQSYEGFCR